MKRLSIVFAAVALIAPVAISAQQSVTVVVNGQTMNFAQPPIVRTGRVFVPLRGVFEKLGASVVYSNGQINATGRGRTISLTIGSTQATVDGQPQTVDVAPFIVADPTFVPLRFISQALGASVNWNDSTSTVTIAGGGRYGGGPSNGGAPYSVRLVSVSPTGTVYGMVPAIHFEFDHRPRIETMRIRIDGRDVTSGLSQSGRGFFVSPPWPLAFGEHNVRVTGTTIDGVDFDLSWGFTRAS
jgi:Copper amine oxidase N-terminal domain